MSQKTPNRFTGLHSHSLSIGDSIGYPQEHIDFALSNGSDSLALTDHGHQNGIPFQQIKVKDLKKKGIAFKAIPGIEAYFIDSLDDWRKLHAEAKASGSLAPKRKKTIKSELELIGNELASTESELDELNVKKDENEESGTVIEDEAESKVSKWFNPLFQRNHLVLLPKNSAGIKSLFRLTSESYINGFYRYPRMDFKSLAANTNGNVIGLSACIGGTASKIIYEELTGYENLKDLGPETTHDFEKVQKRLKEYSEKFLEALGPENYFLELQFNRLPIQSLVNLHILECSRRTGIKIVATADAHYSNPVHWREREIYKAMAWSSKTKGTFDVNLLPKTIDELKCELYPKNHIQMWESYLRYSEPYKEYFEKYNDEVCEAIERTHDIAHQMIGELEFDKSIKLPVLSQISDLSTDKLKVLIDSKKGDETKAAFTELVRKAIDGLIWRKRDKNEEYIERLQYELDTVKELKLAKYFLTYYKIAELISSEMLMGAGRGSAAGSLLAYCLNITQVDPIRFNLLFSRFLSKKKLSMADIDSDSADREHAIEILSEYFGRENVIAVSNFNQLQLRSLIKDVAKLHGVPFEEINPLTSRIEVEVLASKKSEPGFDKAVWVLTFEDAMEYSPTFKQLLEKYPEFQTTIKVLFKQIKSTSRHAGGVILASNTKEAMPIIASGGQLQTPWAEGLNNRHLEEFGLLKFDILGLGTLKMFEECTRKILIKTGNKNPSFPEIKKWFFEHLHPDNNPMTDEKVYKHVFWEGHFSGTFQFVQKNTQEFMRQMKPKNIIDIAIATSVFRPGPLGLGVDKQFLKNRSKPELVVYQHPLLKEVYNETSGLLVFQEQLLMIYHKLAGVPLDECDGVRKSFTKKNISEKDKAAAERDVLQLEFVKKCEEVNGIDSKTSSEIFHNMKSLVAYSFVKAHAVSYAIATFQCAYFLTYYPDEWITTYLDYCTESKGSSTNQEDPKAVAIKEAKKLGYKISKPDINNSSYGFAIHPTQQKNLVPGFSSLKYVGKTVLWELKQNKPYKTAEDLLINENGTWRHSKFNKRALSTLISLEALDSMDLVGIEKTFSNYKQMHHVLIENYDLLKRTSARKKNNNVRELMKNLIEESKDMPDWTPEEKMLTQQELAGSVDFSLIVPDDIQEALDKEGIIPIDEWIPDSKCWAAVSSAALATTKTGKPYLKLKLFGESMREHMCMIWNYKGTGKGLKQNDIIVAEFTGKTDFGFSTFPNKIHKLNKDQWIK